MRYDEIRIELLKSLKQVSFAGDKSGRAYGWGDYSKYSASIDDAVTALVDVNDEELTAIYEIGKTIAGRNPEVAFQYFKTAPKVIKVLSHENLNDWVNRGLEKWEKQGINDAKEFFSRLTEDDVHEISKHILEFHEIHRILRAFVDALGGPDLKLSTDRVANTDTKNLFLPPVVKVFNKRELNFKVYKIILLYEFAQIKYRSLDLVFSKINDVYKEAVFKYKIKRAPDGSFLEKFVGVFPDKNQASTIFEIIENYRIEMLLKSEYRGFWNEIERLEEQFFYSRPDFSNLTGKEIILEALTQRLTYGRVKMGMKPFLRHIADELFDIISGNIKSDSTAEDSVDLTARVYNILDGSLPSSSFGNLDMVFFKPKIIPEKVTSALKESEKEFNDKFQELLRKFNTAFNSEDEKNLSIATYSLFGRPTYYELKDFLSATKIKIDEKKIRQIFREITKFLGNRGEFDYRTAIKMLDILEASLEYGGKGHGTYKSIYKQKRGAYLYPEWDHNLRSYKNRWCKLHEVEVSEKDGGFVDNALRKYWGDVKMIKKQFEMLRPEYVKLFRQEDGEDVDLDACIESFAEIRAGLPTSEKVYLKINRGFRSIAVAFLLDLSGSTSGFVINSEKESLSVMCEALNILGDKFAIFGLSSNSRHACTFYIVKDFDDNYDFRVKSKIGGLKASGFTRLGPAIRHLTTLFKKVESRIKLAILLTDCRPEDADEYSGTYGAEDTRMALIEGRKHQINYFCIDIDPKSAGLASHIFGDRNFVVVEDVSKLAVRLPEIYRRLTT